MAAREALTAKGARQAEAILDAAVRCLGRDGYSATSLQAVADEAGAQKRMVVYYFGSREGLIERVVERVEESLLERVEESVAGIDDPGEALRAAFGQVWDHVLSDRALQAAYFGLVAESVTNDALRAPLGRLRNRYREAIERLIAGLESAGHRPLVDPGALAVVIAAAVHGFGLEFLEAGRTPDLDEAIELTNRLLPLAFTDSR
jgi:AcrR family transcriptional regulator